MHEFCTQVRFTSHPEKMGGIYLDVPKRHNKKLRHKVFSRGNKEAKHTI